MASGVYNNAKQGGTQFVWGTDTIMCLLNSSSYTFDPDHDTVDNVDANELSGTGYVRKTLASKTVTVDDTNDEVRFDAADITWTGANFGTVAGAVVYKFVTNDTDSVPLVWAELTSPAVTNGGDFTLQWSSDGVFKAT